MRARLGIVRGGDVTTEPILKLSRHHMASFVVHAPGCVGVVLLADPGRQAMLAASVWTDARSADRTADLSGETFSAIAAASGATLADSGTYEVLAYDEPPTRVVG